MNVASKTRTGPIYRTSGRPQIPKQVEAELTSRPTERGSCPTNRGDDAAVSCRSQTPSARSGRIVDERSSSSFAPRANLFGGSITFGGTGWAPAYGKTVLSDCAFAKSSSSPLINGHVSSHPESELRRSKSYPKPDMDRLRQLRSSENCPVGMFDGVRDVTCSKAAVDCTSLSVYDAKRLKHTRSIYAPNERYNQGATSAIEIGWFTGNKLAGEFGKPKKPGFPMRQGPETKFYNALKLGGNELCLRLLV